MQRREFITLLSGAVAMSPFAASAQQARVYTLGVLTLPYLTLPNPEPLVEALREGLRDAGYVEGVNSSGDTLGSGQARSPSWSALRLI
jgi:hypothetical protein